MTRRRTTFRCAGCGATAPRWTGRCPGCGEWNALAEEIDQPRVPSRADAALGALRRPAVALNEVDGDVAQPAATGIGELDRVLGGGLVAGSVTLLGGEPGIGKSTLLLQAASAMVARGRRCLLVCAEESPQQVKRRALRLGPAGPGGHQHGPAGPGGHQHGPAGPGGHQHGPAGLAPGLWVVDSTALPALIAAADDVEPDVLVVDSIQTVFDPEIGSSPGSVGQVRACAADLTRLTKSRGLATVLVGHVTKDGHLAGPRVLEHMVDTVLTFEGERHHALRLLRAVKHRFGPTGELGLFEMTDGGLRGVPDPSRLFLGDRRSGASGSAVFPSMEGHRPLLVELQALVAGGGFPMPRRSASGLDAGRLALLVAVLDERAGVSLTGRDVYVSAVGGVRVNEPGADLGTCLALASAARNAPLPDELVICGEVGLAGEIRQVSHTPRRLAEAARLGFKRALVPLSADLVSGTHLEVTRIATLSEAVAWAGLSVNGTRPAGKARADTSASTIAACSHGPAPR